MGTGRQGELQTMSARGREEGRCCVTRVGASGTLTAQRRCDPRLSLLLQRRQLLVCLHHSPLEVQRLRSRGPKEEQPAGWGVRGGGATHTWGLQASRWQVRQTHAATAPVQHHQLPSLLTWYLSLLFSVSSCTQATRERETCRLTICRSPRERRGARFSADHHVFSATGRGRDCGSPMRRPFAPSQHPVAASTHLANPLLERLLLRLGSHQHLPQRLQLSNVA